MKHLTLGIMMALGSSLEDQAKSGQDVRFLTYYLEPYTHSFEHVRLYSYGATVKQELPQGLTVVPNRTNTHRALYALLIPFIQRSTLKQLSVIRVMQMTGALPAALTKLLYGVPYVATFGYCYSDLARLNGLKMTARFLSILEWIGIRTATRIIVTNPVVKTYLTTKRGVPESKIIMIPNGVDTDLFCPKSSKPNDTLTILSVGRLESEKNYEALIDGVARMKHKTKVRLILIGKGSLADKLTERAKDKGVALTIQAPVPYTELAKEYKKADIFVLPSFSEGQPKVALEAMSCGLACLVTPCAGNKAIITHNETGFITSGFAANDIVTGLEALANSETLRHKLGQAARKQILSSYNLKTNVAYEIELLQQIASKA